MGPKARRLIIISPCRTAPMIVGEKYLELVTGPPGGPAVAFQR